MDTETLCLCALSIEPATGYDLKQRFEQVYAHFYATGFGSLYPALGKLAQQGLLEFTATPGPGPRPRKRYFITDKGRQALRVRLAAVEPIHRVHSDFLVLMLMADHLTPERVDELVDQRLEEIELQLSAIKEACSRDADAPPGAEFVRNLGQAMLGAAAEYLTFHRQTLISALRRAGQKHQSFTHEPVTGESA